MSTNDSHWVRKLLDFTGFTLALVGVSLASFKYTTFSTSWFHAHFEDDFAFYLQLGAAIVAIAWFGSLLVAGVAAIAEWGREYGKAMEEAREQFLTSEFAPEDSRSALQTLEKMDEYWRSSKPEEAAPRWHGFASTVWQTLHRISIPRILAVHLVSWGFSAYSISLVHVTVPLGFWVALVAAGTIGLAGAAIVGTYTYAVMIQDRDSREEGESPMTFLTRKLMEEEQ